MHQQGSDLGNRRPAICHGQYHRDEPEQSALHARDEGHSRETISPADFFSHPFLEENFGGDGKRERRKPGREKEAEQKTGNAQRRSGAMC